MTAPNWELLSESFDPSLIQQKGRFDYISHALVTQRLNVAAPGWSTRVVAEHLYEYQGEPHCAGVTLELTIDGIARVETGGPQRRESLALELKNAYSDAIKRCAMRFGVALNIWDKLVDSEHDDDVHPERLEEDAPPTPMQRVREVAGAATVPIRQPATRRAAEPAPISRTPSANSFPSSAPRGCNTDMVVKYLRDNGFGSVTSFPSAIKEVNEWVGENFPGEPQITGTGDWDDKYKQNKIFPSNIYDCAAYYLAKCEPVVESAVTVAAGGVHVADDDDGDVPF